jgi:hypothetical protein
MTVMPAFAPRSEDGQWWWDATQWQPVAQDAGGGTGTATPGDAQAAPSSADQTPSEAVGPLSDDGQWRWDGTRWQPATPATADDGLQVAFGQTRAEAHTTDDGTHAFIVRYDLTNSGRIPIEIGRLEIGFYVLAEGGSAEAAAYVTGDIVDAIAPGEVHRGHWPIQADSGTWTVWVSVKDKITGQVLATSQDMTAAVAGTVHTAPAFDETQTYGLTVTITEFEHIQGNLFRIHYDVQSDRDVPAGLGVSGKIVGNESRSAQLYDLTTSLSAGQVRAHYLTLEADKPDHVTASITVDPSGPSETSDSVEVVIAEDGTSTISR